MAFEGLDLYSLYNKSTGVNDSRYIDSFNGFSSINDSLTIDMVEHLRRDHNLTEAEIVKRLSLPRRQVRGVLRSRLLR